MEIPIVATEHIGIAAFGGFDHSKVVRIAQRGWYR